MMLCSGSDGCLAANVFGNQNIICELTTGLSNETEMQDARNTDLFVLSKFCSFFLERRKIHIPLGMIKMCGNDAQPVNHRLPLNL